MKIPFTLLDFSGEVNGFNSQWDMAMISNLLNGDLWNVPRGFDLVEIPRGQGVQPTCGIVVVPARQNAGLEDKVNEAISEYEWVIVMLIGDEERLFDKSKLKHDHMKVWLMQPKLDDEADFFLGSGYTPHLKEKLPLLFDEYLSKKLDWFFAGQINHPRREEAANVLTAMLEREDCEGELLTTEGFTQGMPKGDYSVSLASAKAVPCPSGIQSPDSFRVFEALEAGAVPVADDFSHVLVHEPGYWRKVFNGEEVPFKIFDNYANLEGYILDVHRDYPAYNNKVFAWWQGYKRRMACTLADQIMELQGWQVQRSLTLDKITVIILTSPIKSHPDTSIIDQTIRDIRKTLPDSEIVIGIDGVRAEQENYRERYEEYKKALLWKCNNEWSNILPVVFDQHMHQAAMTRKLLNLVRTPTILFVEHDTALTPDFDFDWEHLVAAIEYGDAYTIRFHFEASIPEPHLPMMLGSVEDVLGLPMLKTMQWSQRPHLSSTVFYRDMMERYFTDDSRTMIEDVVHGKVQQDCITDGMQGWYKWRLWIYHPEGNIKRSYTTDGRGDDPKYEMRF